MSNRFLVVMLLAALVGCAERSVDQRKSGVLYSGGSSPLISSFSALQGRLRSATDTSEMTSVHASLLPDTGGSTVYFNGLALNATSTNGHAHYAAYLKPNSAYINFSGGSNAFAITGAWAGSFADSLTGPSARTRIITPSAGDTVSKSSGFTVSWSPTADGAAVAVTLADSLPGGRSCGVKTYTGDPGSVTFSASDLSCLNTGRLMLTVRRGFYRMDSLSPARYIQLTLGSSDAVWLRLAP